LVIIDGDSRENFFQFFKIIFKGLITVDLRLTFAENVEVRAVYND